MGQQFPEQHEQYGNDQLRAEKNKYGCQRTFGNGGVNKPVERQCLEDQSHKENQDVLPKVFVPGCLTWRRRDKVGFVKNLLFFLPETQFLKNAALCGFLINSVVSCRMAGFFNVEIRTHHFSGREGGRGAKKQKRKQEQGRHRNLLTTEIRAYILGRFSRFHRDEFCGFTVFLSDFLTRKKFSRTFRNRMFSKVNPML